MKRLFFLLCLPLIFLGCGGDSNPADNGGRPIADGTYVLPAKSFVEFRFSVDADQLRNVFLQGTIEITGGSIDIAVMNETNFQTWQSGATPAVLYSSGLTPRTSFRIQIDTTDTYYLVYSNVQGTDPRTVKSEVFLFSSSEVGEI
jgi:hypothetical protein